MQPGGTMTGMSRKHDPPNKAQLLRDNPGIHSVCELMVEHACLSAKTPNEGEASRASLSQDANSLAHTQARAVPPHSKTRGRKQVVTPERVQMICAMMANGESERAGCLRAGISETAWTMAKRNDAGLRDRIASCRDEWAKCKHTRHVAALYESQLARAAGRAALKPAPTKQAKAVAHYLTTQVPLHFAAIPEQKINAACERYNLPFETWQRQERAFGLLKKVYGRRAAIRGQQQPTQTPNWATQFVPEWAHDYNQNDDEYFG